MKNGSAADAAGAAVAAGDLVEVVAGDVAHGGWCVARHGELVVFVRHTLPGERVLARITQVTAKFARADAVEIRQSAPGRVRPPCPYAKPDGCGGCDWQHASLAVQRELKAQVLRQQLRRIAGLEVDVTVEELPGDHAGLGWRTREKFAVGKDGRAGLYKHRSHEIAHVSDCLIAHPLVTGAEVTRQVWPGARTVDVAVAPASGKRAVMVSGGKPRPAPAFLTQRAAGRDWRVASAGFWQVHPGAADALVQAVLYGLEPAEGESALDLFGGAGLFAGVLADAVGPSGSVIAVESDEAAAEDARHNLRGTPWAQVHLGDAAMVVARLGMAGIDLAVLDPPRTGAERKLIDLLSAGPRLRRVAYVSCDPATLARDLKVFGGHGWRLSGLRAFDAFPMTHHVEALAILLPA
ncbi:MAG TPA: TRAM domain-containing protein [Streptosporangiaceae bacterium]|nr:TRAM domain-containing protein [Streptosporangiaceae bacterium]